MIPDDIYPDRYPGGTKNDNFARIKAEQLHDPLIARRAEQWILEGLLVLPDRMRALDGILGVDDTCDFQSRLQVQAGGSKIGLLGGEAAQILPRLSYWLLQPFVSSRSLSRSLFSPSSAAMIAS